MRHYHPDGEEIVKSFAKGINAYIDLTRADPDLLPMEFAALGLKPEHWTPEVVVSRHNGLFRNVNSEISAARRVLAIGAEETMRLTNFQPKVTDLKVPEDLDLSLLSNRITRLYGAGRSSIRFNRNDILPAYRAGEDQPVPDPLPDDLHLEARDCFLTVLHAGLKRHKPARTQYLFDVRRKNGRVELAIAQKGRSSLTAFLRFSEIIPRTDLTALREGSTFEAIPWQPGKVHGGTGPEVLSCRTVQQSGPGSPASERHG